MCWAASPSVSLVSSPPPLPAPPAGGQPALPGVIRKWGERLIFGYVHLRQTEMESPAKKREPGADTLHPPRPPPLLPPAAAAAAPQPACIFSVFLNFSLISFQGCLSLLHLLLFYRLLAAKLLPSTATFTFKSVKYFHPNSQNMLFRLLGPE